MKKKKKDFTKEIDMLIFNNYYDSYNNNVLTIQIYIIIDSINNFLNNNSLCNEYIDYFSRLLCCTEEPVQYFVIKY